jgi:hypothetical protein
MVEILEILIEIAGIITRSSGINSWPSEFNI